MTLLTPPPPPPLAQKLKKVGFKWGLGLGGPDQKNHWAMCLLDQIMILQGVKETIQPLGVGCKNGPKKVGYVAFICGPYMYACLALF